MILKPEELARLNSIMLENGAPVEKDNIGYNQADYMTCHRIGTNLSNEECYTLSKTLYKYASTQLGIDKTILEETMKSYAKYEKGKHVYVLRQDSIGVWCKWGYNADLVEGMRRINKQLYKWVKTASGEYECRLSYEGLDVFIELFKSINVDYSELTGITRIADAEPAKPVSIDTSRVYDIHVRRIDIDYLGIKFDYTQELVDLIKKVPTSYFNKGKVEWEIDLTYAADLYRAFETAKTPINLKQLKPWAIQMSFNSNYEFTTDLSKLPFSPRDYQIADAKEMLLKKARINANEMGVGKTLECILVGESLPFPKLVICPASLRINWRKEIRMVNPDADIVVLQSSDEFKVGKDWTIIGYSSLDKHSSNLEKQYFRAIFADEAHFIKAIKNSGQPDSSRAEVVLRLSKTAEYAFPVTGTPKTNRNKDLFNLLKMVRHPMVQGKWAFSNYGKTFCDGVHNGWGWDYEGSSNDKQLHDKISPYIIRHLKSEVLPHIKKMRSFIPVQVDLREYQREIAEYLKSRTSSQAVQLTKLMRAKLVLAKRKAPETVSLAKDLVEQGEKVIIVTCFTEVVQQVEKAFKDKCVKIVGGMSDIAKDKSVTSFQTGDAMVCVMNIIAGGVGLTLTASHNVIMNDFDWVPGNMVQAEDRAARSGQEYLTNVMYMYAEGADMDELLAEVLTEKFDTINAAIDGGNGEQVDLKAMVEYMLEQKDKGIVVKAKDIKSTRITVTPSNETLVQRNTQPPSIPQKLEQKTQPKLASLDLKKLSLDELIAYAESLNLDWKRNDNAGIHRMRVTMAIKKALQ